MNKFIICGRISNDIELRYTQSGNAVARFNFAVNRRYKQEGEPDADFFSCVAFGKTAEVFSKCQVSKGAKLLIEGEVRNNNYEKDGVKHYGMQVIVNTFEFCESKAASGQQATAQPSYTQQPEQRTILDPPPGFTPVQTELDGDEDLPF